MLVIIVKKNGFIQNWRKIEKEENPQEKQQL